MNETKLKIINDERFADSGTEKQMQMLGALSFILALALDSDDKQFAWDTMNEASKIGHILDCPAFNTLYNAAAMEITRNFSKKEKQKRTLYRRIKEAFAWKN